MLSIFKILQVTKTPLICAVLLLMGASAAMQIEGVVTYRLPLGALLISLGLLTHFWRQEALYAVAFTFALTSTLFHLSFKDMPPESISYRSLWAHGIVKSISERSNGRYNVWLEKPRLFTHEGAIDVPSARLSVAASQISDLKVGEGASVQGKAFAPEPMEEGETFDAISYARFYGPSVRGYGQGLIASSALLESAPARDISMIKRTYWKIRQGYYNLVIARTSGEGGALLTALMTGHRDGVSYETKSEFRKAGLSHLLAISGLHLALVTGLAYFGLRRIIGCNPKIIDRINTQKWAAVPALMLCVSYMLMAGASLPTVRASVVLGLLLIAILIDHNANPLRLLCVAVWVVVALWPYSVVGPSFQMSFVAAFALMLFSRMGYKEHYHWSMGWWHMPFGYMKGIFAGSLIATFATMPFVAWHFGTVSLLGLFANLIAVPLTGLIILPMALLAVVLMPVGLDAPFWYISQWGAELLIHWAKWIDTIPFGVFDISHENVIYLVGSLLLGLALWSLKSTLAKRRQLRYSGPHQ
ncbi:MAG: ComEC/Rec2 family competence protein [Alphaproteobacteria bacterium]|nr:ComEC/Rec2 family competence protein [Alphaproteobacteria bacterium]